MKKITFLLLAVFYSVVGYCQFPQNFDEITPYPDGLPTGWIIANNGVGLNQSWRLTNQPPPYVNGTQAMLINLEEIGQGNTSEDFLITNLITVPADGQLRFQSHQTIQGNQGTIFQVRYSTNVANQADISQYQILQTWTEPQMNAVYDVFEEKVVDLTPTLTAGQQVYIAFVRVFTQPGNSQSGDRWVLDDVNITSQCFNPANLEAENIASTSATLVWEHEGAAINYEIELLGANASATGVATEETGNADLFYNKTGLLEDTGYKYFLRAECEPNVFSEWVGPFFFNTIPFGTVCSDPIQVTTLPYETDANTGDFGNSIVGPQGTDCGATPTGTNYLAGNDVIYRVVAPTDGIISITLTPGAARSSVFVYDECADIGTACEAGVANSNSTTRVINNFPVVAGEDYYVVISSGLPTQTHPYNLIIQYENCDKPTNLGFDQANATLDGGTASWSEAGTATSWEVAVQPAGTSIPSGPGSYISFIDNDGVAGMLLTGLQTATLYQYWVRSECSPGVYSAWAGPFVFNTAICLPEDQCTYTFRMTDSANNGWNGARMQIRQNGIVLPILPVSNPPNTIGGTYTSGAGPVDITVTMCDGVPFDVFWLTAGSQPQQCILSVINSFGQTIFVKPAGSGVPGSVVYNGIVNCDTPQCDLAPTAVTTTDITTVGATVTWTAPGTENVGYDIYYVLAGGAPPTAATPPTASGVNGPAAPFFHVIPNGLTADTTYDVYVRVICNTPGNSPWSAVHTFTTLPTCPKPIDLVVTPGSITLNSAELVWVEDGVATEWEVLLLAAPDGVAPAAPGVTPVLAPGDLYYQGLTGASTFTPTNLVNATIYYYYVRAVCGGNDPSTWSGPIIFNTITCAEEDKCVFRFRLTNTTGNTWNGARMQVRQNGIVVATIGNNMINNPTGVAVSLCNDVPIDVFWSVEGNQPETIGFDIVSPFTDIIHTMLPGTETPLTIVYDDNELGNCVPPTCPKPINLDVTVGSITQTTAELFWTEEGTAQQWEVYAVPVGSALPVNGTPLNTDVPGYYLTGINQNPFTVTGLEPGTNYIYYVRAVCSADDISTWTILGPDTFTTKPINDECSAAIPVPVNPTRECVQTVSGNTLGATGSLQEIGCTGAVSTGRDDDIWFSFIATNPIHVIQFSNVVGSVNDDIDHALYFGDECDNLVPIYCSDPYNSIATNLQIGETYKIRVYTRGTSPANGTNPRHASFDLCIITPEPITNDECTTAIVAAVNDGLTCETVTPGSITGATASPQSSTCAGIEDDDVWFQFTATSPTHIIDFINVFGSLSDDINHSLYAGDDCGNLTLEYCSAENQSIAEDLEVGTVYKIRVWSALGTVQDITFDLCIGSIVPPITVSTTEYTNEELVTEILIKSECATVTNIAWSTGTGANNGIGYFNKDESQFPFEDGIVLISGSALSVPGPNTSILSGGGLGGDADLSAILAAQTPPVTGTLNNATSLEFDFVAIDPNINFEFMFASEEYGTFQCGFSDAFAFILTDVTEGTDPVNLAVIPGSEPPVPVTVYNIRDNAYNAGCPSVNAEYFGNYYANAAGVLGAPINFNGITIPMVASSAVIPGHTYHIKMVIADINDSAYDSAVFLKGGSFNIGNINLPEDYLIADGTALCLGDDVLLDSELDPTLYTVQWFNGTDLLEGETNPTLVVSESGTYVIEAAYIGTDCVTSDSIVVEYFLDADAGTPNDLLLCDASGNGIFDLTSNETIILAPFTPDTHDVVYFLTEEDAQNNVLENAIPVEDLEAFPGTNGQTIYVRVNFLGTSCFQVVDFNLVVEDLTPQFTLLGAQQICPEGSTTITVSPTANNFNPALVTYTWTFGSDTLAETSGSLTINGEAGYGTYTVTVNNSGCSSTQTFEITNANTTWFFDLDAPADLCPQETGTLSVNVTNNPNGFPVTYTYTLVDGSEIVSNNSSITIDEPGTYSVMIDIQGCISGPETVTIGESVADWQIAFEGEPYIICPSQSVTLSFTATNFDINNPVATYTWTSPSGVESQGTTFNANEVGTYTLEVDIFGCTSSFEVDVEENTVAIEVEFVQGCESNQYHLEVNPSNGTFDPLTATYVWSGPDVRVTEEPNVIILGTNGEYSVTITTQDGCSVTESIMVNNVGCQIQKGISPNNDGDNDSFDLSAFNVREITIFNRYGTEVYNYANYVDQWYGQSSGGKELPDGTYFYVFQTVEGDKITGWIYINR